MSNNHGLRTTGTHTGNFGRPKVQGKPGTIELSPTTLKKDSLRVNRPEEAYARLKEALEKATDPKMRKVLEEMIRSREATRIRTQVPKAVNRTESYWDTVKRVR